MDTFLKKLNTLSAGAGKALALVALLAIAYLPFAGPFSVPVAQADNFSDYASCMQTNSAGNVGCGVLLSPAINTVDISTRSMDQLYRKAGVSPSCVNALIGSGSDTSACTSQDTNTLKSQFGYGPGCVVGNASACNATEAQAYANVRGAVFGTMTFSKAVGSNAINQINQTPGGQQALQSAAQAAAAAGTGGGGSKDDFACSVTSGEGLAICMTSIVYYIGPGLASNVAYVGAYLFSYAVSLSLNNVAYALDFLSSGWTTVRDLANMAFILILVYIAFMVMFRAETAGTLKLLAWVIFIALIINFSFFLTRVVIDAGNILAVQFYNAIPPNASQPNMGAYLQNTDKLAGFGGSGVKDLSFSIMDAVGLQSLLSKTSFEAARMAAGGSTMGALITLSLVYLALAVMFWVLFFVFLQVGIKFLMRVVVLWFVIISAPLALVARAMPSESANNYYSRWQTLLIQYSFYPAIFLFIYLILVKFLQQMLASANGGNLVSNIFSGGLNNSFNAGAAAANTGIASAIANVSIRMGFIVAMFYIALKASDWIASEGSNAAQNVTGRLTGAALGTGAFAGKIGIGRFVGNPLANSQKLKNGNVFARGLWNTGRFLNSRTYDVRNLPGTKKALGLAGGDLVKGRVLDVGQGHKQTAKELEEKMYSIGDRLGLNGRSEAAIKDGQALDEKIKKRQEREGAKELGELNKQWEPEDKRLGEIKKEKDSNEKALTELKKERDSYILGGQSYPPEKESEIAKRELRTKDLDVEKDVVEERMEKIRGRRETLIKQTEGMSGAQIASLSTANIEAIIKQVSDSQLKAIKESQRFTGESIKTLSKAWNEQNKKAPMIKSMDELEKLDKIHAELEKLGINKKSIKEHEKTPNGDIVINLKSAKDLKDALEEEKGIQEAIKHGPDGTKRQQAQMGINQLNKAIKHVETIIENLEKMPEGTGDGKAPGEFIIKKA